MSDIWLTREQSREVDRRAVETYEMPSIVLMENAGRGVTDGITRQHPPAAVTVCCGKGNNGGDGFVIARHLDLRGWPVQVLTTAADTEYTGDAAVNLRILRHTEVPIRQLSQDATISDWEAAMTGAAHVVDALLGTGASGDPRPPYDAAIDAINRSATHVVAVDVPSGLDCDTGSPGKPTVRADETFTFVAAKRGFAETGAAAYVGQLHVVDIGTPTKLLRDVLGAAP